MKEYKQELPEDIYNLLNELKCSDKPKKETWDKLWDELHHQGDVYISSYISVPLIFEIYENKNWLDANLPAFLCVIENCRGKQQNQNLPDHLEESYYKALNEAVKYIANKIEQEWDREILIYFLMLISAIKKNENLFEILDIVSDSPIDETFLLNSYYENN